MEVPTTWDQRMAQTGVETAIKAAKGEPVDARIDTGSFLVLPSNLDQHARESGMVRFMQVK